MNDKKNILAFQWIRKAKNDLITARHTLDLDPCPTDIICFHSQQVIEKSIKSFLTYYQISFPKIHELIRLLDLALESLPDLEKFRNDLAEISNYAIEVRYPGEFNDPSLEEAIKSIKIAEEVFYLIEKKVHPDLLDL